MKPWTSGRMLAQDSGTAWEELPIGDSRGGHCFPPHAKVVRELHLPGICPLWPQRLKEAESIRRREFLIGYRRETTFQPCFKTELAFS